MEPLSFCLSFTLCLTEAKNSKEREKSFLKIRKESFFRRSDGSSVTEKSKSIFSGRIRIDPTGFGSNQSEPENLATLRRKRSLVSEKGRVRIPELFISLLCFFHYTAFVKVCTFLLRHSNSSIDSETLSGAFSICTSSSALRFGQQRLRTLSMSSMSA